MGWARDDAVVRGSETMREHGQACNQGGKVLATKRGQCVRRRARRREATPLGVRWGKAREDGIADPNEVGKGAGGTGRKTTPLGAQTKWWGEVGGGRG